MQVDPFVGIIDQGDEGTDLGLAHGLDFLMGAA
jgi:hypothetical protein